MQSTSVAATPYYTKGDAAGEADPDLKVGPPDRPPSRSVHVELTVCIQPKRPGGRGAKRVVERELLGRHLRTPTRDGQTVRPAGGVRVS